MCVRVCVCGGDGEGRGREEEGLKANGERKNKGWESPRTTVTRIIACGAQSPLRCVAGSKRSQWRWLWWVDGYGALHEQGRARKAQ